MRSSLLSGQFIGTFALLAATLMASKLSSHRKSDFLAQPLETISRNIAGFVGVDNPPLDEHTLHALNPTTYLGRTYTKPGLAADLFISFYAQQRAGESMHSPKHCLPGAGWEIWSYNVATVTAGDQTFTINKYSISHEGERRLVLYWYQSKERIIASEYLGKFLLAKDTLLHHSTAASIVRIIVPDQPGAFDQGRLFASGLIPQVQHCFGSL